MLRPDNTATRAAPFDSLQVADTDLPPLAAADALEVLGNVLPVDRVRTRLAERLDLHPGVEVLIVETASAAARPPPARST